MLPELEQLLILQDRQQKIRQIEAETKTLPQQRKALDAQVAATAAALEALKQKSKQVEVDRKKLELDANTRRDSISKLRTQQYETRKNEEFRAIGNEIERYEKEIQQIEDHELDLMEQAETLKKELTAEEKRATTSRDLVQRQVADLEEKTKALDVRLAELKKQREQIAAGIDEDLLSRFDRLFASKGDAAIVALEHEVCTGCHMKVTTQTAHHVKNGKDIVSCEQCGRMLYSPDNTG